ncbi:MAG: hypothetical protein LAO55_27105 [Acidobacteriia bacterium]|nr:hypothetical protein [Terriglobia bacterium]
MLPFLVFAVLLLPLCGQDVDDILKRNREANKQNEERAKQYTYVEETENFEYDNHGERKKTGSETHDVIFVEGESYRRLVARDGKALPPNEEAREEKKLQQTAEERRKARRKGLLNFSRTVSVSSEDLDKFFDRSLVGEEEIRGRKAWVIEYTPQKGHVPANKHEKDVYTFQAKAWVDEEEGVTSKFVLLSIADGSLMKPGSSLTFENAKINDDAWLPVSSVLDVRIQIALVIRDSVRTETRNSNFKKFDVKSTITASDH